MKRFKKLLLCALALFSPVCLAQAAGDRPPANPTHSIALCENGTLKNEKPASEYPEEIRFKKAGGQWVPVTRIEVVFVGKKGRVNSSDEAERIVIHYYGADGAMVDLLTMRKNLPQ